MILDMVRPAIATCLLLTNCLLALQDNPSFDSDIAREHEIKPHRDTIPLEGVRAGFNALGITLTVSAAGDVIQAEPVVNAEMSKFWPQLKGEVLQWKFAPFEKNGRPVMAKVQEYITLVPPERLPKVHVTAPEVGPNSAVTITLKRTQCFGSCPAYSVAVTTDGIAFIGDVNVVAYGKHTDHVDADAVRRLATEFVSADFYSLDAKYMARVTDLPTFILSLEIDGHHTSVVDYRGRWEGMPEVVIALENQVDAFARTSRWVEGTDGLVSALRAENFDFKTFDAQTILKKAAARGQTATARQLLEAGVPLNPLPNSKIQQKAMPGSFEHVGWLNAASRHPETLRVFIEAGASKNDQSDKDVALATAAGSGNLEAVRELIAYGANPNADAGRVLISAAQSGKPEVLSEILRYHPKLEAQDQEGQTAMFAAARHGYRDAEGARVECIRLLAKNGANVNPRDKDGNTPLHDNTLATDVAEELLKLGANVNARNDMGETPIFTTFNDAAIPLFIKHGADLTIRNKKDETVMEAAQTRGAQWQETVRRAIQSSASQ